VVQYRQKGNVIVKITLESINVRYGTALAVSDLNIEIGDGELFSLIGPSGCGKTTTLRMIAGLLNPTSGRILFGNDVIADPAARRLVPTAERKLGMVFQSYALWPHLSIANNLGLGLKVRKLSSGEIATRIRETLSLVGLQGRENDYPHQLSGGQQQRVALARAIVLKPRVLLFDEPLSNLDASLREQMRDEIRSLQQKIGITAIYVTHDQTEALAISDRIGVMQQGRLVQCDSPAALYRAPANAFVAGFLGRANLLSARIEKGQVLVGNTCIAMTAAADTAQVTALVRPETVQMGQGTLTGSIERAVYLGGATEYLVHVEALGTRLKVQETSNPSLRSGATAIAIPPESVVLVPA
jgi:ABC-type Fe3+/spermidine/putrescine transport system ATPase subunit